MFQNLTNTFTHLPMVWDVIIPLLVVGLFCTVLFWEGLYGHAHRIIKKIRGEQPEDNVS